MPRKARMKSASGIYHVILRGQNRQIIFEDEEDKERFLQTLDDCRIKSGCKIFGYCLMVNHIHLLIQECNENVDIIMRRIGASYVYWYNYKYQRCGHLFQDRYRSEAVEDDIYFMTVLRYIHQNPVKAGVVEKASEYKWSSYNNYLNRCGTVDFEFALGMFSEDSDKAILSFINYHEESKDDQCLDLVDTKKINDKEAQEIIKSRCGITSCPDLRNFESAVRNEFIDYFKQAGLSARQIERLTGISRVIVQRV